MKNLPHGIYRLYWKQGGSSVASVGSLADGTRWFAPSNWINVPSTDWSNVSYVELIATQMLGVIQKNVP